MEDDSYYKGLATGVSDGTASGRRGAQEHGARIARVHDESRKLGENLMAIVVALFWHPYFSFLGFWIVCFGSLMALAPVIGVSDKGLNNLPPWYGWSAAALPVVLAVLLRKIIPKLMKGLFVTGVFVLAVLFVVQVWELRKDRDKEPAPRQTSAAHSEAPLSAKSRSQAPLSAKTRAERIAAVKSALKEAANPDITFTAPGSHPPGELFEGIDLRICSMTMGGHEVCPRYCATLAEADRPDWCR